MIRVTQQFMAVSSATLLSRSMMVDRSIFHLGTVFSLPYVHQLGKLRLKHTGKEAKHKEMKQRKKKSMRQKLPQAKVPQELREMCHTRTDLLQYSPCLGENLSMENYLERFTNLIHLEEIQQEISLESFSMKNVKFRDDGELLNLYVPAVATGSLIMMPDDQLIITNSKKTDLPQQIAYVCRVHNGNLQLRFSKEFREQYTEDLPAWNVSFILNRISIRRCHRAVQHSEALGSKMLFPCTLDLKLPQLVLKDDDDFFNPCLNKKQKSAIKQIVGGESRPVPYILFGPPGTGKTVTVVEAILQIYTKIPDSRILVCAPSNSAVNLLVVKLHKSGQLNTKKMARHFAARYMDMDDDDESIPECVRPYSIVLDNVEQAFKYRIILTTCNSAGAMYSLGLKVGHFTHVFIDEAGQATEPESLIPTLLMSSTVGQITLSGDPHQLGPVVLSVKAQQFGLDVSLLERLMELPIYSRNTSTYSQHGSYNPLLVTKLVKNFRSHPSILKPSSEMFYHDELQAEGDIETIGLCNLKYLPVQDVPLIFHCVQGTEEIGVYKPSRCNMEEADIVLMYLKKLFDTVVGLKEEHIGVITPYSLQVEVLQEMISGQLYKNIDVGTVEKFQGQERRIIIISTVRSSEETIGSNQSLLGFLVNPRRFNVSISRAQALLIVTGNSNILNKNYHWKTFIDYCKSLGVFINGENQGQV